MIRGSYVVTAVKKCKIKIPKSWKVIRIDEQNRRVEIKRQIGGELLSKDANFSLECHLQILVSTAEYGEPVELNN